MNLNDFPFTSNYLKNSLLFRFNEKKLRNSNIDCLPNQSMIQFCTIIISFSGWRIVDWQQVLITAGKNYHFSIITNKNHYKE